MIDQRPLLVGQADRIFGEGLVPFEEAPIEANFGIELSDFGKGRIVRIAQCRAADHGVKMSHRSPSATQPFGGILQRLHDGRPGH